MNIINQILKRHSAAEPSEPAEPHAPEILYIGCIDARLDPIDDIGIPKGKASIIRNIAAFVPKADPNDSLSISTGAALEFFLENLPEKPLKHIVVSGHTDCGGLKACAADDHSHLGHNLQRYLENFDDIRSSVHAANSDDAAILKALETSSVSQSMQNLFTYPVVLKALAAGKVQIHGWVIDTHTKLVRPVALKKPVRPRRLSAPSRVAGAARR